MAEIMDTVTASQQMVENPIPTAIAPPVTIGGNSSLNAPDTPPPSKRTLSKSETAKAVDASFEQDPFGYLRAKVQSLILWENRRNSALVLTGTLSFLILTQYYSLLQIAAGIFFFITGLNWVFVIIYKQGQKYIYGKAPEELTNPHRERLRYNGSYIPRDRIVHLAQLSVDVFEVFAQHITKLVLIENSWRSAVALVISFTVWTLAKYISTKYLIGLFLLSAFTGPRLYLQHQAVIDAHLQQLLQQTQSSTEKYGGLACAKAKELSHQATEFIKRTTAKATTAVKTKPINNSATTDTTSATVTNVPEMNEKKDH